MLSLDQALPPLRQDLAVHAGPRAVDGSPTWTLHDPAANRFYELRWPAFEVLSRWTQGSAAEVLAAVRRETTLQVDTQALSALLGMLSQHHLLQARSAADTERLQRANEARHLGPWRWLLHHYLFFRWPLWRPMPWLQRVAPWVGWAYRPAFWGAVLLAAVTGLALVSQRWEAFTHTFAEYASWSGLLALAAAMSLAKVLHELGHAFTAHRYGCRVPTMGVAFLVMWPVLYTDTNEAWKLASRRQRLAIAAAGMLTELALAAWATLAWALLPDTPQWGPVRAAAFLLATTTWVLTLAINASPFMRFDGYFLLADAVNMPNLHERAFAFGRWWLRERLLGWGDAAPEPVTARRQLFLVAFALATWVYRLLLFFGIALLVYHLFFKALGLLLMAVELGWFIVMPVWRELTVWRRRPQAWRWNPATRRLLAGGLGLLLLVWWPWQTRMRVPAVLGAQQAQGLYARYPSRVSSPWPAPGARLRQGELLTRLESPDLALALARAEAREAQLQWQVAQQPFDSRLMEAGPALRTRWAAAQAEVQGLRREREQLQLSMPFEGQVVEVATEVGPGSWVRAGEKLMQLVGTGGVKVDAYVDDTALHRLQAQQAAWFVPNSPEPARVHCAQVQADAVQLSQLDASALVLASPAGGSLPARRLADGRWVPVQAVFRVRLSDCDAAAVARSEIAGVAVLQGQRQSLAEAAWAWCVALWRREIGG